MADKTLTDDDLKALSEGENPLVDPLDDGECLEGSSYDFRAGGKVVVVSPEANEHHTRSLEDEGEIEVEPGYAYTFYSLEQVRFPNDLKGRLSLRSHLANKKLLYSGGLVDPGYEGYLFFNILNLGTTTLTIEHGEPIVTGEFVRIEETTPYEGGPVTSLPADKLPALSDEPREVRNWEEVNELLTEHEETLRKVESMEAEFEQIDSFMRNLVYAAIAAAIAGVFAGVTIQILNAVLS